MIALVRGVMAASTSRRIDALGVTGDVDHHGHGTGKQYGAGGGHERRVGDDHLVAHADAERRHHDFDGMGAVGDGDAVLGAVGGGELAFEGLGPRARFATRHGSPARH
ncbi:MAG: hypothetical protein R3C10_14790 [Pirellulales bacterium]